MARNEEKQLARLNRFYLEQQKQEELKKKPPRPRLNTLNTAREIRKWLPTITRDIGYYVKQLQVLSYPEAKIQEINERIGHLRGEYRAYLCRLRQLDPGSSVVSWSRRPYSRCRRPVGDSHQRHSQERIACDEHIWMRNTEIINTCIPPSTPLTNFSHTSKPDSGDILPGLSQSVNSQMQDEPLQFKSSPACYVGQHGFQTDSDRHCSTITSCIHTSGISHHHITVCEAQDDVPMESASSSSSFGSLGASCVDTAVNPIGSRRDGRLFPRVLYRDRLKISDGDISPFGYVPEQRIRSRLTSITEANVGASTQLLNCGCKMSALKEGDDPCDRGTCGPQAASNELNIDYSSSSDEVN